MTATSSTGLVVTLPSDREIVMTRFFAAPRYLVFDAWTKPEHLAHWYGKRGWTLRACEVDLRPGGSWRFVSQGPGGATMINHGLYREVLRPERLVHTENFDGDEHERMGGESLCTLVLQERDSGTAMTRTIVYPSRDGRDAALQTPMKEGTASAFERLDEHLRTMTVGVVADRYRRLSAAFADKIANIPPGGWDAPTPCTDWSVRELVLHVVEMNCAHVRLAGLQAPPGPDARDDPLAAFDHVRDVVQANLADPARAAAELVTRAGRWTFAEGIERSVCVDLAVHGWDLARATEQDERIDPAELPHLWKAVTSIDEKVLRAPDAFGPPATAPPDADEQARFLAHLGRHV